MAACIGANLAIVNVGFIHMGGARNFAHFAAKSTLTFLTRRQVKCWFIIDRDEREDAEIVALKERLGDAAVLTVLDKREIENYLLSPRAIAEYLRTRAEEPNRHAVDAVTDGQIRAAMNECAEELRELTIYKRVVKRLCGANYSALPRREVLADGYIEAVEQDFADRIAGLTRDAEQITEVAEEIRHEVDVVWEARKLDMVPGEELLGCLFRRFGLRYRKDRDGPRLAALIQPGEVHLDLKSTIEAIAREGPPP